MGDNTNLVGLSGKDMYILVDGLRPAKGDDRNKEIEKIYKEMVDIKELHEQMLYLVKKQGVDIIKVDENIKGTEDKVDSGVKEIQIAYDKRRICVIL
jgi:t-SNARE complex subunit (syntaxin)